jgi:hypothetical protein
MKELDTSSKVRKVQIEILRKMGPEQRLRVSLELTGLSKKLLEEGVRSRHPKYSEQEVKLAVIRILLGNELFEIVYPDAKNLKP